MTAALVALAATVVVLAGVLGAVVLAHGRERRDWTLERRSLVDRAIAQHTGEVIAMDRAQQARKDREPPKLIEGLS